MHHYTIRRYARSKTIRITIKPTREVLVTAPSWVSRLDIDQFIKNREDWIQKHLATLPQNPDPRFLTQSKRQYHKHKETARRLITEKVLHWNQYYLFTYGRIAIKNNRTNWGSCSAQGNLNFNYKILFLSESLQDYIIVHELCHLGELSHSKKFWTLVERTIPNHKTLRRQIREQNFGSLD